MARAGETDEMLMELSWSSFFVCTPYWPPDGSAGLAVACSSLSFLAVVVAACLVILAAAIVVVAAGHDNRQQHT